VHVILVFAVTYHMYKKRVIQTFKAGSAVTTARRAVGIQERLHLGWRG